MVIQRQSLHGLVAVTLTCASFGAGGVQENPKTASKPAPGASAGLVEPAPPLPPLPRVGPVAIPGFSDDAAYVRSIAARVAQLAAQADQTDELSRRADFLLAAANLLLARQLEPACTQRLLRLDGNRELLAEGALRDAFDLAEKLLGRAREAIGTHPESGESPAGQADAAAQKLETLQALTVGLRAYLLPAEGAQGARDARRAASRVSPLLEDRNRQVAAAANLWAACLRSRETDPTRAMSALDPALSDPAAGTMPYSFFARLLRCRLAAADGNHAVALALLMQIEERCEEWLETDEQRANARRTAQLVGIQILADWYGHLDGPGRAEQRKWCADRINAVVKENFGDRSDTVVRLEYAIPLVADPPVVDAAAAKTATP